MTTNRNFQNFLTKVEVDKACKNGRGSRDLNISVVELQLSNEN